MPKRSPRYKSRRLIAANGYPDVALIAWRGDEITLVQSYGSRTQTLMLDAAQVKALCEHLTGKDGRRVPSK